MLCALPAEESLKEDTPADARAVRSEGFEILRKAALAQSVVADRHRRRSNAAGAREAVGFAVERDIGIDPRHQRDRRTVGEGKCVSVRVDFGGRRHLKTKKKTKLESETSIATIL